MLEWKKLGKIFDPTEVKGKSWMKTHAQSPGTVVFDNFVRVYFSCRPVPVNGKYVSRTAFLDLDRNDLSKIVNIADDPVLELGDSGSFDEFAIYPTSVIRNEEVDERRFPVRSLRLYYAGWTRMDSVPFTCAVGMATSYDDGIKFERYSNGPILGISPEDPYLLSGARIRKFNGRWYLFYLSGTKWIPDNGRMEAVYKIRMAVSNDGITSWKRLGNNIISDKIDNNECQAGADVFYHQVKYHMYFAYRPALDFRSKESGYRIGYAYSTDLFNWVRDDSQAGITLSESGWDSEMQHYPHVFELDGNHYMIYNGNEFGKYGFGLADLEK